MKATHLTGMADDGTNVRLYTIRQKDDGSFVLMTNPGDVVAGDPWSMRWTTLARARHAQQALIRKDGRRSAAAVSMFVIPTTKFVGLNGGMKGRWVDFASFCAHMLTISDGEYKGETHEDRVTTTKAVLTQESWPEF